LTILKKLKKTRSSIQLIKAMVVNRDGTILEGSTNLFNLNIEDILSGSKN